MGAVCRVDRVLIVFTTVRFFAAHDDIFVIIVINLIVKRAVFAAGRSADDAVVQMILVIEHL